MLKLRKAPALEIVVLSSNNLEDFAVSKFVEHSPQIKKLHIASNSGRSISSVVSGLSELSELWVNNNVLGRGMALPINVRCKNLTLLNMYRCSLKDSNLNVIEQLMTKMQVIHLGGNNFSEKRVQMFMSRGFKHLKLITLGGNQQPLLDASFCFRFLYSRLYSACFLRFLIISSHSF